MNTELVTLTLSIVVENNTHRNQTTFSEDWNFTMGRYVFNRISENEVRISFSFEAILKEFDENHQLIEECPSEYLPEYQEFEQEIEALLDLFSLEVGAGLAIKEESFLFSSATCRDNEFKNIRLIDPSKTKELYLLFSKPEAANDKKLRLALRLYRQSVSTNDRREQMIKLYAALEQLFSDEEGRMFDKAEIHQLKNVINTLAFSSEKKKIILDRVCDIRKSPKTKIVEKLELMHEDEKISEDEKRQLVGTWNKYRSSIAHGEIVSKRDEDFDYAVAQIDTIVEAILKRSVEHRMREKEL